MQTNVILPRQFAYVCMDVTQTALRNWPLRFFFVALTISHVGECRNSGNPRWKISNCKSRSPAAQEYSESLLLMLGVKFPVWPKKTSGVESAKTAGRFMEDSGWNRRKVTHLTVNGLLLEGENHVLVAPFPWVHTTVVIVPWLDMIGCLCLPVFWANTC